MPSRTSGTIKQEGDTMKALRGIISDRIRSGEIEGEALTGNRVSASDQAPPASAVRGAEGHGLGSGATAARTPTGNEA